GVGSRALRSGAPILPVWLSGTAELYLRKELATIAGTPRAARKDVPTKEATRTLALALHDDLARLEPSERAPDPARKRMRWLTNLFYTRISRSSEVSSSTRTLRRSTSMSPRHSKSATSLFTLIRVDPTAAERRS